jgi:D-proline reductase (dithiol) PrdB
VGLLQREIEAAGISTVSMTVVREVMEGIKPPRAVHVRFPFGFTFGEPFARDQQLTIAEDALAALQNAQEPGTIVDLPYRWKREDYAAMRRRREATQE